MASLQDEYMMQRHHHQMMMQDQMQQRLMAHELAQARNQEYEADNFMAMMNAARNNNYLQEEQEARNRDELIARLSAEHRAGAQLNDIALMDQIRNLSRQGMSTTPQNNAATPSNMAADQTPSPAPKREEESPTKVKAEKKTKDEDTDANQNKDGESVKRGRKVRSDKGKKKGPRKPKGTMGRGFTPMAAVSAAEATPADDPDSKPRAYSVDEGSSPQKMTEGGGMAKVLAGQKTQSDSTADVDKSEAKLPALEKADEQMVAQQADDVGAKSPKKRKGSEDTDGESTPKQKRKQKKDKEGEDGKVKVVQELTKAGKLDGRTKKARALKKQVLDEQRILTDQEKTIINFMGGNLSEAAGDTSVEEKEKLKRKRDHTKTDSDRDDVEDEFAANVVLKFKRTSSIPPNEVKVVTLWSKRGAHKQFNHAPSVTVKDYPYITPNLKFNLPLLPVEPELIETEEVIPSSSAVDSLIEASNLLGDLAGAKTGQITPEPRDIFKLKSTIAEKWWPADKSIDHERKLLGGSSVEDGDDADSVDAGKGIKFKKKSLVDAKKRMDDSVEPGVLELLPCCKLYEELRSKTGSNPNVPDEPKFCFQVADAFPDEVMICCSECSTWRHAQCGGHYKHYSRNSTDPDNVVFNPLCDRCFLERDVIKGNGRAAKRLDIQRIDHLRRCNVTNAVMQQYAFSRHMQSKWPLGSVSAAHFAGHARGVQSRHEKGEKLWEALVANLDSGKERSKDRARYRTRALERILLSVEDAGKPIRSIIIVLFVNTTTNIDHYTVAEVNTDIHNMILFLQNDTSKVHPAGFEKFRRNIFDPEEDPVSVVVQHSKSDDSSLLPQDVIIDGDMRETVLDEDMNVAELIMDTDMRQTSIDKNQTARTTKSETNPKPVVESLYCARTGCQQKPRFDSIFCSDSCGVSTLEMDLLQSLKYAQELHPSVLRS